MIKSFTFFSDPGHGWLQVSATDAASVGLKAKDFSICSFRNEGTFYLEEDCDAPKFKSAWERFHGEINFKEKYIDNSCFIRELNRIHD